MFLLLIDVLLVDVSYASTGPLNEVPPEKVGEDVIPGTPLPSSRGPSPPEDVRLPLGTSLEEEDEEQEDNLEDSTGGIPPSTEKPVSV